MRPAQSLAMRFVGLVGLLVCFVAQRPVLADDANRAYQHPWMVGIQSGFSTIGSDDELVHSVIGTWGVDCTYAVLPYLSVGMTHLHFNGATVVNESRWGWGLAPSVEAFHFPLDWLQLVAKAGLIVQHRWGADLEQVVGVTPFVSGGIRSWATSFFSIGLEGSLYMVAGDGHLFSSRVLPQGSMVGAINLSFNFHLGSRRPSLSGAALLQPGGSDIPQSTLVPITSSEQEETSDTEAVPADEADEEPTAPADESGRTPAMEDDSPVPPTELE